MPVNLLKSPLNSISDSFEFTSCHKTRIIVEIVDFRGKTIICFIKIWVALFSSMATGPLAEGLCLDISST